MKKYTLASNFKFIFLPIWQKKRRYIWDLIGEVLLSVMVPFLGAALSALIIGLLAKQVNTLTLILCVLAVFAGYGLVNAAQSFISARHALHNIEVRIELFMSQFIGKMLEMPLEDGECATVRTMMEKANVAISNNRTGVEGFSRSVTSLCTAVTGLLVYAAVAGWVHPLILLMLCVFSFISAWAAQRPNRYYNRIKDELAAGQMTIKYIDRVVDNVKGGKDIRVFGLKDWIIGKYDGAIRNARRLLVKRDALSFLSKVVIHMLDGARSLICYLYLIHLLQQGMSIAQFVFLLEIVGGFSAWFMRISEEVVKVKQCSVEVSDLRSYLEFERTMQEKYLLPENNFSEIEIVFDHVSYQYENANQPVLKDISFRIKAGEHMALVGLNGAGKSTLVKLIAGLYLPTSGNIYINGINTKELDREEYYRHQAAVFQDAFTLAYSIGENIVFDEEWDELLIWDCLKMAGLFQKVDSLPQKLDTYLGKDVAEDGIMLSGGEMQKLLLARALYRNPTLLLLDEPTAALDAIAESEIYETYSETLKGKTALFISHRLASTRFCDEILLLADGQLAERGTHEELLERGGAYSELFQVQSKYYEAHAEQEMGEVV
ncbi:MAG: ABC transporter ATP-binding protein/permease [Acetatifactor sp.]|nr:ABC transporter ATP-binding protein/permease [Acetatifactor sp.]